MPKVYAYGCKPDKDTRDAIAGQLWLAHRYRLMLWHLAMASRSLYREQRRIFVPELIEAELELLALLPPEEHEEQKKDKAELQALKVALQGARAKCRELREAAKTNAGLLAASAESQERMYILQRALRNVFSRTFGLYSGTYLHIEAASRSANAGSEDPVRPRWDGSGALAIQFQGGRSVVDIMHGDDPSIHIQPPPSEGSRLQRRRTTVHYRLKSDAKGRAVLLALPTMLHRPLPEDSKVTWGKLVVSRIHEFRYAYSVQFTVESDSFDTSCGAGVVAVCFRDNNIYYAAEEDEKETLFAVSDRAAVKIRDLQSIRDQHRNSAIALLVEWCERQDEIADWVRDEIATIEDRKSCRRLYHLRDRLRKVIDEKLMAHLDEWAHKENHLYTWQSDARRNALNHRKHEYRVFVRNLRRRFRTLAVDNRRLDDPKRMTWENRSKGLHEFRLALTNVFGDDAIRFTGDTCGELCERLRDVTKPAPARETENGKASEPLQKVKKAKRTGFARKHEERKAAARDAGAISTE